MNIFRNVIATTILAASLVASIQAVHSQTITRTVRPGGTVSLVNFSVYDLAWCYSQAPQPDVRPAPKLGRIVETVFRRDLNHICKQMLFRAVAYRAGKTRGVDRFSLFFVGEGDMTEYQVTVHVR